MSRKTSGVGSSVQHRSSRTALFTRPRSGAEKNARSGQRICLSMLGDCCEQFFGFRVLGICVDGYTHKVRMAHCVCEVRRWRVVGLVEENPERRTWISQLRLSC